MGGGRWAATLNRSSPAAEVHVDIVQAEAERKEASGRQAVKCQIERTSVQWC